MALFIDLDELTTRENSDQLSVARGNNTGRMSIATLLYTAEEIKALYEGNSDTNALTDDLLTRLSGFTLAQVLSAFDSATIDGVRDGRTLVLARNSGDANENVNILLLADSSVTPAKLDTRDETKKTAIRNEIAAAGLDSVFHFIPDTDVTGSANAITLTYALPGRTTYFKGLALRFIAEASNTGHVTINLNGWGAKAVVRNDGSSFVAGDITSGRLILVQYDGTNFVSEIGSSGSGSGGGGGEDTVARAAAAKALAQAPASSLRRLPLGSPYTAIAFNQANYDGGVISAGDIMISAELAVGGHGILIGLTDQDAEIFDYIQAAGEEGGVNIRGMVSGTTELNGTIHTVVEHAPGRVLIRVDPVVLGSISAGDELALSFGNRTLTLIAALQAADGGGGGGGGELNWSIFPIATGTDIGDFGGTPATISFGAASRSHESGITLASGDAGLALEPGTYEFFVKVVADRSDASGFGHNRANLRVILENDDGDTLDDQNAIGYFRGGEPADFDEGALSQHIIRLTEATTVVIKLIESREDSGNPTYTTDTGGQVTVKRVSELSEAEASSSDFHYFPPDQVTGTANNIILTSDSGEEITSYEENYTAIFQIKSANTGEVTVNIDGQGVKQLLDVHQSHFLPNILVPNLMVTAVYLDGYFVAININQASIQRISSLLYSEQHKTTPRRGAHLPNKSVARELYTLTEDGTHPTDDHIWTFKMAVARLDSFPRYQVTGAAIAGGIPRLAAALGTNRSAVFTNAAIRAVYGSSENQDIYVVADDALVIDPATRPAGNYRISVNAPHSSGEDEDQNFVFTTQGAEITTQAGEGTRTIRFAFDDAEDHLWASVVNIPGDQLSNFVLSYSGSYLRSDGSGGYEFGGVGEAIQAGTYEGDHDGMGGWHRVMIDKAPRVLQAAVDAGDNAGTVVLTLPTDYEIYRRLSFAVWSVQNNRLLEGELHTASLAVQTDERSIAIGNRGGSNIVQVRWDPAPRTVTGSNQIRFVYAVLED